VTDLPDDPGYTGPGKLELIWGEGFMSPGGPAEVTRIVGPADLRGRVVLDLGCGLGGADVVLVTGHGAASVVGADVQDDLLHAAGNRAARLGLQDRIRYQPIVPGPLPFADGSFDAVFSKDALLHVADKPTLYRDLFRILRPGGLLLISDWLRGPGQDIDALLSEFVAAAGHAFHMVTLPHIAGCAAQAGFTDIETLDRGAWYLQEARSELARLRGSLGTRFATDFGDQALADEISFWEVLVRALEAGAMAPGHLRALKPVTA
jgi:SAM-dependent methyltransferase